MSHILFYRLKRMHDDVRRDMAGRYSAIDQKDTGWGPSSLAI